MGFYVVITIRKDIDYVQVGHDHSETTSVVNDKKGDKTYASLSGRLIDPSAFSKTRLALAGILSTG